MRTEVSGIKKKHQIGRSSGSFSQWGFSCPITDPDFHGGRKIKSQSQIVRKSSASEHLKLHGCMFETYRCSFIYAPIHSLIFLRYFGDRMSAVPSLIFMHHQPRCEISAVCLQRTDVSTQIQKRSSSCSHSQSPGCQVVSLRRRRNQTKPWVPTEGYFTKRLLGCASFG